MEHFSLLAGFPYLASLFVALWGLSTVVRHRSETIAQIYGFLLLAQVLWTVFAGLELFAPTLDQKIFYDNLQFPPFFFLAPLALWFSLEYVRLPRPWPSLAFLFLAIPALVFSVLVFWDPVGSLIRDNPHLIRNEFFNELYYGFPPLISMIILVNYGLGAVVIGIFLWSAFWGHRQEFWRNLVLALAFAVGYLGGLITVIGQDWGLPRDVSPFTLALSSLLVLGALYKNRGEGLRLEAWKKLLADHSEVALVMDDEARLHWLSPAAQTLFARLRKGKKLEGRLLGALLPDLVEQDGPGPLPVEWDGQLYLARIEAVTAGKRLLGRLVVLVKATSLQAGTCADDELEAFARSRHLDQLELLASVQSDNQRLVAVQNQAPFGVLVFSRDHLVISVNRVWSKLWPKPCLVRPGMTAEDTLDELGLQVLDPEAVLVRFREILFSTNPVRDMVRLTDGRSLELFADCLSGGDQSLGRVWYFWDGRPDAGSAAP